MFRTVITLLGLAVCAFPAFAQTPVNATRIGTPGLGPDYTCFEIDARRGWQRVATHAMHQPVIFVLGPRTRQRQLDVGMVPFDGWSVDGARYAKVDAEGHSGNAANALAPHDRYKYHPDAAFGAFLLRRDDGAVWAPGFSQTGFQLRPSRYWDLRINDSDASLGDNSGSMGVCLVEKAALQ